MKSRKSTKKHYTEADLVSFGLYLLSDERKQLFQSTITGLSVAERLKDVHHADLENWKETNNTEKIY